MREIKFRVWDGEKIISPDYIDRQGRANWKENSVPICLGVNTNKDAVLMQFTGLKDKDGVDIYEGDIIYVAQWKQKRWEVIFYKGCFCIVSNSTDDLPFFTDCGYSEIGSVIGNIYENPELL